MAGIAGPSQRQLVQIDERSDIDRDQAVDVDALGEDWGDGFYVQQEPVLIKRDAQGNIRQTIPLSEVAAHRKAAKGQDAEPTLVDSIKTPSPLSTEDREKLAFIIAKRLWDWYRTQRRNIVELNPIYDGVPTCREHRKGCPLSGCEKVRPVKRVHMSEAQVLEWLRRVVAERVQITNRREGYQGWRPSISISKGKKSE